MDRLSIPKRQSDLVHTLGMTPDQARRLLDALSSIGGFTFRRSPVGERLLSDQQFDALCALHRTLRPEQVTQEFVRAAIRSLSSLPPEETDDFWRVAVNIATDVGDTRNRVLAIWQLLEQAAGDLHLKLPDWQAAFHLEDPSNAR